MTDQHAKVAMDIAAGSVMLATIAGWLPPIAAVFTIIWCGMQMYGWVRRKEWRPK